MSRIAKARQLADDIQTELDYMSVQDMLEMTRLYDLSSGFVEAIRAGWISGVTESAVQELEYFLAEVRRFNSDESTSLRNSIAPGDVMQIHGYELNTPSIVQVLNSHALNPHHMWRCVVLEGENKGQEVWVDLFLNNSRASLVSADNI